MIDVIHKTYLRDHAMPLGSSMSAMYISILTADGPYRRRRLIVTAVWPLPNKVSGDSHSNQQQCQDTAPDQAIFLPGHRGIIGFSRYRVEFIEHIGTSWGDLTARGLILRDTNPAIVAAGCATPGCLRAH